MHIPPSVLVFLIAVLIIALWRWRKPLFDPRPFPPGPRPKWLVGNLFDIPTQSPWLVFTEWKKRFEDILFLQALGNSIVVLNRAESITDLLDKRSNIYSDRPVLPMAGELIGLDHSTGMLQYGNTWRKHRKLTKTALSPDAVKKYIPVQEHIAALYLRTLLDTPKEFIPQLRLTAGRIVMAVTYGISVERADEEYITDAESTLDMVNRTMVPGTYMVDLIPALKHVPAGLASFKKEASEGRRAVLQMVTRPLEHVKREMASGKAPPSFTSDFLRSIESERGHVDRDDEEIIKWTSGTMYAAGGETTFATLLSFILAMALFPSAQQKAQAELDAVVGPDRLPSIRDREGLPYVNALIKEVMRWYVILPLSVVHRSAQDDFYKGYFIPAGSLVMPNVWAIAHDESTHIQPHNFIPERFLPNADGKSECTLDPHAYAFGFGRRICPGRFLGDNSLFIVISYMLAMFHIMKPLDADGREVPVVPEFTKGMVSYPEPFECRFVPRSARAVRLVRSKASEGYNG